MQAQSSSKKVVPLHRKHASSSPSSHFVSGVLLHQKKKSTSLPTLVSDARSTAPPVTATSPPRQIGPFTQSIDAAGSFGHRQSGSGLRGPSRVRLCCFRKLLGSTSASRTLWLTFNGLSPSPSSIVSRLQHASSHAFDIFISRRRCCRSFQDPY